MTFPVLLGWFSCKSHDCLVLQVGSAITRMTIKSEANVAASLGLVKVSIKILSKTSLQSLALVSNIRLYCARHSTIPMLLFVCSVVLCLTSSFHA